jgi:kanamycin kinase
VDVTAPAALAELLGRGPSRLVWRNDAGGLTYELPGPPRRFLKWSPASSTADLWDEVSRLRWARPFTRVPEVVDWGRADDGTWMITEALSGRSAVDVRWLADPSGAVRAIGEGLRDFHESLPVADCPFSWHADERVADARRRATRGLIAPSAFHEEFRSMDVGAAVEAVADPPPADRLVVCQADACAPNTLIGDEGRCSGHVDLGRMGVADRWADLAVATWSATWNYGPGWEGELLAAYGVQPDPDRTAYYRLLWDLGPE